ncbi:HNH endonuclease [Dyadobacter sp. OTU695]|uniref:HNH endonuclease n=1 Tax=Dyadobacter sp. OTU695 TaxID=3043860 RepID=UPI00313C7631
MRKIYNDEVLKRVFNKYKQNLFSTRDFRLPKEALAALIALPNRAQLYQLPNAKIDAYIGKIINEYEAIIMADQPKMITLIKEFGTIVAVSKIKKRFYEDIVRAMRYDALREKEFIQMVQELGIKTCVYCHAQLTLVIDKEYYKRNFPDIPARKGDVRFRRALLELDHRHPKSKYPFLSTTFYNLYPVCGSCNRIKSKNESTFDLYCDHKDVEVFRFSLDKDSVIDCLTKKDKSLIKISINWLNINDDDAKKYLNMFDIQQIYDTQKDIIEELLHKKVVYNDKYKKELHDEFRLLFPDPSMVNRLIIGNYDQPEDVLKRPMAKFVQDIARDIELIPKI